MAVRPAHRAVRAGAQLRRGRAVARQLAGYRHRGRRDLVFYPAAVPLRALVAARHGARPGGPPPGTDAAGLLAGYAAALGRDPWLDTARRPAAPARRPQPCLSDAAGNALPLHPAAGDCWPLFALSGGRPLTVAGEWTPRGLWPLTAWDDGGMAVPL